MLHVQRRLKQTTALTKTSSLTSIVDPIFRRAQRDLSLLMSLGFSQTMVQKSLFIASGVHAEALHWLIDNQHHPNVETPWNMTQLQVGWEKGHVGHWPHGSMARKFRRSNTYSPLRAGLTVTRQEQIALRNTRRNLVEVVISPRKLGS